VSHEASKIRLIMELRRQGIEDVGILEAIERVPREAFVAEPFRDRAYDDNALPIAQGQTISQPFVVAFMTQALRLNKRAKVLEIGTGSGYQAAILSRLCRRVYTVERYRSLQQAAEERFRSLKLHNVVTRFGDGSKGWPEQAPFDRILVTAAAEKLPDALVAQLADGGVLVAPVGPHGDQRIVRLVRRGTEVTREELLPVRFVPLVEGVARER